VPRTPVDERRWIGQRRFLHALNHCLLLPGPEAQQLATHVGWLLNGNRGGLVAGGPFVLPDAAGLAVEALAAAGGEQALLVVQLPLQDPQALVGQPGAVPPAQQLLALRGDHRAAQPQRRLVRR
jgi:chromate transporter